MAKATLAAGLGAMLVGCAAPGEPIARHPVVPRAVQDLSAQQRGDGVLLTFTLPTESTDRKPLGETPAVEIFRGTPPPGGATGAKTAMRLVDTIPSDMVDSYKKDSHVEFRDQLDPADLSRQPGQQVTYTVRTRVSEQRASVDSNPVKLLVYPAPPPVSDLHATLLKTSIQLTWTSPESGATSGVSPAMAAYRVYRAEIDPKDAAAAVADPSKAVLRGALSPVALVHTLEYQDADVVIGHTYLYLVRSVAQFGSDTVESTDSMSLVVTAMDVFPPATPENLVAIVVPATNRAPAYVELSWSISPEVDLAGYSVYRSDQSEAPGELLNNELLSSPTFRDTNVTAGRQYFYRIRAVDRAGNESPFSAETEADLTGR
jgi:hypothetical protein